MKVNITGHHITITPAIEANILDKLACVERHYDHINSMQVVLSLDNKHTETSRKGHANHKAEAILRVPGAELFAHAEADDMYASIAKLSDKLDKQIIRHKERGRVKHADKDKMRFAV